MTANISHEINNPLTVAMGNAELVEFSLANKDLTKRESQLLNLWPISLSLERMKELCPT